MSLVRSYVNLVEDGTRVMQRIKALFRARGIKTPGTSVYRQSTRKGWLSQLEGRGARTRAEALLAELDVLQELAAEGQGSDDRRSPPAARMVASGLPQRILALAENPRPVGVEKLSGTNEKYRIRQGDFLMLYEIQDDVLIMSSVFRRKATTSSSTG